MWLIGMSFFHSERGNKPALENSIPSTDVRISTESQRRSGVRGRVLEDSAAGQR
jgi:hypothetical protein